MPEVRKITIVRDPVATWKRLLGQFFMWSFIVGAIGLSRMWFGGAVILDIFAVIIVILILAALTRSSSGMDVVFTKHELRNWVVAGMPDDVDQWRKDTNWHDRNSSRAS